MSELSAVRALAKRYADGRLERRAYIVERRRVIDAITGGELALASAPPTGMPPVALAPCALKEIDASEAVHQPAVSDALPFTSTWDWWLVVGMTSGLVAVAAWLWVGLQPP